MIKALVILSLALGALAIINEETVTRIENLESYSFEKYLEEYEKTYSEEEHGSREALFYKNLAMIIEHNNDKTQPWRMGVNQFTDVTYEEMSQFKGYKRTTNRNQFSSEDFLAEEKSLDSYPKSVDWRNKAGVLTAVKNQHACGSCWAFSATESIESALAISTGQDAQELSVQEINACTPNPYHCGGTGGCDGATPQLAFEYIAGEGIATEADYPYSRFTIKTPKCKISEKTIVANIKGYKNCTENSQTSLLDAIQNQPVSISVDASNMMQFYYDGDFIGCGKDADLDHAIQLVGYDMTDPDNMYWIVRNSWGTLWGQKGYGQIKMYPKASDWCGTDKTPADGTGCEGGPSTIKVCGMCGILYSNAYPVV